MITAVILAGGLGTRLKKTVPTVPKPMAPISGRPFLEYLMDYWIDQGVTDFILSVSHLRHIIIEHFGKSYRGASIVYSIEDSPLGTGGALLLAAMNLKETFLLLNGDTFIEVDFEKLYDFHKEKQSDWTFSLFKSDEFNRYMGLNLSDDGKILTLKDNENNTNQLANGGVYLIHPSALKRLNYKAGSFASLEDELLPNYIAYGGELFGLECKGRFIDIGIPDDYRRAHSILND